MDYSSGPFWHQQTDEEVSLPLKKEKLNKNVRLVIYSYFTTNFLYTHISKLSKRYRAHLSEHRLSLLCPRPLLFVHPSHLKTSLSRDLQHRLHQRLLSFADELCLRVHWNNPRANLSPMSQAKMIENALQFVGKLSPEYVRESLSVSWTGPEIERLAPMVVKEEFYGGFKALRWNCK
jgi:hypothetical protein